MEMRAAVQSLGYSSVSIFRPSVIDGDRKEPRRREKLAMALFPFVIPLLVGPLRKYRPIAASAIAEAMLRAARENRPGVHVFESDGKSFRMA